MWREELRSYQHFLVYCELERARHKVVNYALENLNANFVDGILDQFLNNLKCAAKMNLASGFVLGNIEDGGFRYFYSHENNTLLDRSKLACTRDDLANLKCFFNKPDFLDFFNREKTNTKWRFCN